jgi:hypothetical protein
VIWIQQRKLEMGCIPPPRPLSREEVQERVDAGARTLFEIDPELGNWHRRNQVFFGLQIAAIVLSVVTLLGTVLMLGWLEVMR